MKIGLYACGGEQCMSEHQLGIGYLLSNVHNAQLVDVKDPEKLSQFDMVGFSSNSFGLSEAWHLAETLNVPTIIGGNGAMWEGLHDGPFTWIVRGDGEIALTKIIDGTAKPGIVNYKVDDIDSLAPPIRGVCKSGEIPIFTSRGCPYECGYCSSSAFWGDVRWHSAEYILEEVERILVEYPKMRILYTLDDLFTGHKPRLRKLAEAWKERDYAKRFHIRGFVRANLMDEWLAKTCKEMGFLIARFGAESGSNRILKMLNKNTTVAQNQRCIDLLYNAGVRASMSIMQGFPTETPQERQDTLNFISKNRGKAIVEGNYLYKSFPGTPMYNGDSPMELDMRYRLG